MSLNVKKTVLLSTLVTYTLLNSFMVASSELNDSDKAVELETPPFWLLELRERTGATISDADGRVVVRAASEDPGEKCPNWPRC